MLANVSCLRAANFGDRSTPPPTGFYEQLTWSGLAMLAASLVGLFALFAPRLRHGSRTILLFATIVVLVAAPITAPRPDSVAEALDVAKSMLTWLAPVVAVALVYLLAGLRRAPNG